MCHLTLGKVPLEPSEPKQQGGLTGSAETQVSQTRIVKRLLIVGTSGVGKSTLARAAADRLGLPFMASDDYWWEPGWKPARDEDVRARVAAIADQDRWVLESNFDSLRDSLWPRADLVVWLDFARPVVFARIVRRNLGWALRHRTVWAGNRMTFRRAWSGIRHAMRSYGGKQANYPGWLAHHAPTHVRFRRPAEAHMWLEDLKPVVKVSGEAERPGPLANKRIQPTTRSARGG